MLDKSKHGKSLSQAIEYALHACIVEHRKREESKQALHKNNCQKINKRNYPWKGWIAQG